MDILNWVYLLKNKLVKTTVQDPEKDLLVLGNNVSYVKRGDKYQSYGMTVQDFATYVNESVAGNCPIEMNFKPGSIGEKVSFRKESGTNPNTNKDIIIPGLLEITRGNGGGGIYNIAVEPNYNTGNDSPQYTFWNTQYVDPANTSWASLWDVQNRTYTDWRGAVDVPPGLYAPPQYVGISSVMKYDDGNTVRYWLIMFTEWGVGQYNEYGFAYDRYEILPAVDFSQPSASNTNTPNVIDILSDGVHITRAYTGGTLYNTVNEPYSNNGVSPRNTKWNSIFTDSRTGYSGYTDLSNLESRVYTDFYNALDQQVGNNIPGTDLIMHDMTTNLYYKVDFTQWAQGCGGDGQPGGVIGYDILDPGAGYPNGSYAISGTGGSGTDINFIVTVTGGIITSVDIIDNSGENYEPGDIITFPYLGVTAVFTIEVLSVCKMGGFAYTRTVIPQSCGVKFADGTIMNTASGTTGTAMKYVTGTFDPQAESDFIALPDTITTDNGDLLKTYKLGGIVNFNGIGVSTYAYLIGVISGDTGLRLINDATVIGAKGVTTYNAVSGKFTVNALVKNASTGAAIPLTFATIVLDNTIAGLDDYFVFIVAGAGAPWVGTAYIDIEFMSDQVLSYFN